MQTLNTQDVVERGSECDLGFLKNPNEDNPFRGYRGLFEPLRNRRDAHIDFLFG